MSAERMHGDLKGAFQLAFGRGLAQLGYTNSDTIFVQELSPGVLGCIGYLTSNLWNGIGIKPFVGVQFEQVERLYEELIQPLRVVSKSTSRYYPNLSRNLYDLKEERSADPDFRLKEKQYLRIEPETVLEVSDKILTDVQRYGLPYIEFNSTLTNAAASMVEGHGGGIGTVAYMLPIIYWTLGQTNEAKSYMASIATKGYPIGPYERYVALLIARMDSGPAPLLANLH